MQSDRWLSAETHAYVRALALSIATALAGAAYLITVTLVAVPLNEPNAWKAALVSGALAYACNASQALLPRHRVFNLILFCLCAGFGLLALVFLLQK
jgi:hypothetical protein